MQRCQLRLWSVYDPGWVPEVYSDVSHIPEACHSPSADSPQGCQQVSSSPGRATVVQVGSLPGWRTRPKGGGCELECVGIGTLGAAPGVSTAVVPQRPKEQLLGWGGARGQLQRLRLEPHWYFRWRWVLLAGLVWLHISLQPTYATGQV